MNTNLASTPLNDRLLFHLEGLEKELKDKDRALLHIEQIHREKLSELQTKISLLEQDRAGSEQRLQVVPHLAALTDRSILFSPRILPRNKTNFDNV